MQFLPTLIISFSLLLLSHIISALNTINTNNIQDHISVGLGMYSIASRLQYGMDIDIIISTDFRTEANQMIDYYISLTTNQSFINILNIIKQDLADFEGKTRVEVLNEIS